MIVFAFVFVFVFVSSPLIILGVWLHEVAGGNHSNQQIIICFEKQCGGALNINFLPYNTIQPCFNNTMQVTMLLQYNTSDHTQQRCRLNYRVLLHIVLLGFLVWLKDGPKAIFFQHRAVLKTRSPRYEVAEHLLRFQSRWSEDVIAQDTITSLDLGQLLIGCGARPKDCQDHQFNLNIRSVVETSRFLQKITSSLPNILKQKYMRIKTEIL